MNFTTFSLTPSALTVKNETTALFSMLKDAYLFQGSKNYSSVRRVTRGGYDFIVHTIRVDIKTNKLIGAEDEALQEDQRQRLQETQIEELKKIVNNEKLNENNKWKIRLDRVFNDSPTLIVTYDSEYGEIKPVRYVGSGRFNRVVEFSGITTVTGEQVAEAVIGKILNRHLTHAEKRANSQERARRVARDLGPEVTARYIGVVKIRRWTGSRWQNEHLDVYESLLGDAEKADIKDWEKVWLADKIYKEKGRWLPDMNGNDNVMRCKDTRNPVVADIGSARKGDSSDSLAMHSIEDITKSHAEYWNHESFETDTHRITNQFIQSIDLAERLDYTCEEPLGSLYAGYRTTKIEIGEITENNYKEFVAGFDQWVKSESVRFGNKKPKVGGWRTTPIHHNRKQKPKMADDHGPAKKTKLNHDNGDEPKHVLGNPKNPFFKSPVESPINTVEGKVDNKKNQRRFGCAIC